MNIEKLAISSFIKSLIDEGYSQKKIANTLGIGQATVSRIVNKEGLKVNKRAKSRLETMMQELKGKTISKQSLIDWYLTKHEGYLEPSVKELVNTALSIGINVICLKSY